MRDLPSLNAIRVFESAARHLNFTRAADELSVTQGAVSRQIKTLEDQLGQPLFRRAGPKLQLTSAGEQYQVKVAEALTLLRRGTAEIRRAAASPALTVSVLPTFASRWLVPLLVDFERSNPQVALHLVASYKVIDFTTEPDIDLAIRLGRGVWSGVHATRLTSTHVFPVCSPTIARNLHEPQDIQQQRILMENPDYDEWPSWFKAAGVEYRSKEVRILDDDNMLLQSAIAGQGITLAREVLAKDDLDAGRLVRPFEVSILSAFQYYFVCPPERVTQPNIKAFLAWLQRMMDATYA